MSEESLWVSSENISRLAAVRSFRALRDVLAKRGPFSRATVEEPVEEVLGADPDQREDDLQVRPFPVFEPIEPVRDPAHPWVQLGTPIHRTEDHVFRYFLDGSLRTYRWGEKVEGGISFPVIVTEVGCAVVFRENDGLVRRRAFSRRLCLLLPPSPPVSTDTADDLLAYVPPTGSGEGLRVEVVRLAREKHVGDLRSALLGKARSVMHELEVDVASSFELEEGRWLIIDGAIRKGIFMKLRHTIGLAKSFSRKPFFVFPPNRRAIDTVALLRGMPAGARSPVFVPRGRTQTSESVVGGSVASWYVRLREPTLQGDPLHGIVKVDYIVEGEWAPDRDEPTVDRLSRALLAERSVSAYPTPRWATHIYPIYCAETYLKSSLLNPVIMRGLMEA
jgi:hypothetical protein